MEKHKFASISLTVRERAISSQFSTHRISEKYTLGNFQKIFLSPKMVAILYFRIFAQNGKTQICFYLLNRVGESDFVAIFDSQDIWEIYPWQFSKKFSPHQKSRPFWIFAQNGKTQICFYFLNRAGESDFVEILDPQTIWELYSWQFSKNFPLPTYGGHFEFSSKMAKNTNLPLSP